MSKIDPSYLRSIRDGIRNGNLEANNLEALPEGLVGLYDKELFPPTMKWKERKETVQFFLVFAFAQKEISADFASTILGDEWCKVHANENETTEEKRLKKVNEFIQLHSKRFTNVGEGKFRLYHERFRVYILQKVTEGDLAKFNHKFISLCESELKNNTEKDIPEKESYALEFLSTHYFISAMQGEKVCLNMKDADSLKNLVYDQAYWERQVKASKGFEWSKKMLNEMMQWSTKFDKEEVIECSSQLIYFLNFIKSKADHKTLDEKLSNIRSLYISQDYFKEKIECYFDLILDELKANNELVVKKENIDKILIEFNKNVPLFDSEINDFYWNNYISEKLVFFIAKELSKLNCDWKLVFNNYFFLDKKSFFNSMNSEFDLDKNDLFLFKDIFELKKQDYQPEFESYLEYKANSLLDISTALFQLNQHDEAKTIIKSIVNDNFLRFKDFLDNLKKRITSILFTFGYADPALKIANSIKDEKIREAAQRIVNEEDKLTFETNKNRKIELASFEENIIEFKSALTIEKQENHDELFYQIALRYYFLGDELNGFENQNKIENKSLINNLLIELCIDYTKKNNLVEAINIIDTKIIDNESKVIAIKYVLDELIAKNEFDSAKELMKKGINELQYRESITGKKIVRHFSISSFELGEHDKSAKLVDEMSDIFMKLITKIDIDISFNSSNNLRKLIEEFDFKNNISFYLKEWPNDGYILFEYLVEIVEKLYLKNEFDLINVILSQIDRAGMDAWRCKAIIYILLGDLSSSIKFSEYFLHDKVGYDYLMKSIASALLFKKDFLNAEKIYLMIKSQEYRSDLSIDYSNYILNNENKNYVFSSLSKCFNNNFFSSPILTKDYLFSHLSVLPSKEMKTMIINQISNQLNFSNFNKEVLISLIPFEVNNKTFRFLLKIYYLNLRLIEKENNFLKKHDGIIKELNLNNLN
jgi:hypothetical protein